MKETIENEKILCYERGKANYPESLANISNAPEKLYVWGELPDIRKKSVAIIGAREASAYGRWAAFEFAKQLADEDVQIISGMAKGIDAAAHQGALTAGKKTFAVLGCGVDICYPVNNRTLYEDIKKQGGIISEYENGSEPIAWHFPMRNRIISALSDLVLVIEARKKSGALITADAALEQGKDVFAMPGRITDDLSQGCHYLIAQGAGIAWNVEEILIALFKQKIQVKKKIKNVNNLQKKISGLARDEETVYSCMGLQPKHISELLKETGLEIQSLLSVLLSLELKGLVKENTKNYYIIKMGM